MGEPVRPAVKDQTSLIPVCANYSRTNWDKNEWTIDGSPTQCANLSLADFFSIPLKPRGRQTDDGKTELSWKEGTAELYFNKLKAAAGNIDYRPSHPRQWSCGNRPGNQPILDKGKSFLLYELQALYRRGERKNN